jgi:hypothetical protein
MRRAPAMKRKKPSASIAGEATLSEPLPRWAPSAIIAVTTLLMLVWTWGRWPDLLIDFSRDLYVASQLAHGKVLYRDIAFFTGPLSPYINATWLRVFGASFHALVGLNIIIFVGFLWLLFELLREIGSRLAATVGSVFFVTTFGLAHLVPMGNYNFICPYSHDMVHGIVLGFGAVYGLARFARSHSWKAAWATGILLGLVQLTRAEVSLPVVAACVCGVLVLALRDPAVRPLRLRLALAVVGPAIAIPAFLLFVLAAAMPWGTAARGVLGSWGWIFDSSVSGMSFYQEGMGLDDWTGNLARMLAWSAIYTGVLLPLVLFAVRTRPEQRVRNRVLLATSALASIVIILGWRHTAPADLARPLPVLVAILGVILLIKIRKLPLQVAGSPLRAANLMFVVLAFGFLGKILLNARFVHYGFVFAVPAAMLAVLSLVDWVPAWISARSGNGATFRWACISLLAGLVGVFLQLSGTFLARKSTPVGEGSNAFIADARGEQLNAVLAFLAREVPAGQSLAAVPEGAMINILSGRSNPGFCLNLMPPEIATLGESRVLSDLEKSPPDVIVVDLDRIGPDGLWFRRETFAPNIANWILGHYQLVARFESPPTQMMRIRLGVLRHQPAQPQQGDGAPSPS